MRCSHELYISFILFVILVLKCFMSFCKIPLPTRPQWFYLFNVTEEDIQKVCLTVLQVYQTVKVVTVISTVHFFV